MLSIKAKHIEKTKRYIFLLPSSSSCYSLIDFIDVAFAPKIIDFYESFCSAVFDLSSF